MFNALEQNSFVKCVKIANKNIKLCAIAYVCYVRQKLLSIPVNKCVLNNNYIFNN